jgi:hypothetical protein
MNRFFTSDEVYQDRLAICKECVYYFKLTGQCKRCLCFMRVKARIGTLKCPENKWQKTTELEMPEGLPEELIEEVKIVYPDIKSGKAKNQEVKRRAIELYNTIYNTNYNTGTNCGTCLESCLNAITKLYNKYGG